MSRYEPFYKSVVKLRKLPWVLNNLNKLRSFRKRKWKYIKNNIKKSIKKLNTYKRRKYKRSFFFINGIVSRKYTRFSKLKVDKINFKLLLQNRQYFRFVYGYNRFKFYKMKKIMRKITKKSGNERVSVNYKLVKHLELNPFIILLREGFVKKFNDSKFLVIKKKIIKNNKLNFIKRFNMLSPMSIKIDFLTFFFIYPHFSSYTVKQNSIYIRSSLIKRYAYSRVSCRVSNFFLNRKKNNIWNKVLVFNSNEKKIIKLKISKNNFNFKKDFNYIKFNKYFLRSLENSLFSTFVTLFITKINKIYVNNRLLNKKQNKKKLRLNNLKSSNILIPIREKNYYFYSESKKTSFDLKKKIEVLVEEKKTKYEKNIYFKRNWLFIKSLKADIKKHNLNLHYIRKRNLKRRKKCTVKRKFLTKSFSYKKRFKFKRKRKKLRLIITVSNNYETNYKTLMLTYLNKYSLISKKTRKEIIPVSLGMVSTHLSY